MRRVAVLRPAPGASETLARASALGLPAFGLPLFLIESMAWKAPDPDQFDALLLTSANAVRNAGPKLETIRALPAHAVGEATAAVAGAAGLNVASSGNGGVDELLKTLPTSLRLLHLCGEERKQPKMRHQITAVPVYRSTIIAEPPGIGQLRGSVALVHSPRAGQRLAELVTDRSTTAIVAISPAAAGACGAGWDEIMIADEPRDEALLSLAAALCKQSCPE